MSNEGGQVLVLIGPYLVIIVIGALLGSAEELWDHLVRRLQRNHRASAPSTSAAANTETKD